MMKKQYTVQEDGFRAVWFEGSMDRQHAVIYMTGARCGERITTDSAQYLVEAGYSVLCLGFYYWKGMSDNLDSIPVEYVERAVTELQRNGYGRIAIHGISTGAGYALLCASLIPDISCVLAIVPYDYVMEAMKHDLFPLGRAVYTHRGKSLPYSRYTCVNDGLLKGLRQFFACRKEKGYRLTHMGRFGYDTSDENEPSRIKVENMRARVLLIAADKDDAWPSDVAVPRMERILKEAGYPYPVTAIVYEKASHALGINQSAYLGNPAIRWLIRFKLTNEKLYPEQCAAARADCLRQILHALEMWRQEG